jgi:hypothetical protein
LERIVPSETSSQKVSDCIGIVKAPVAQQLHDKGRQIRQTSQLLSVYRLGNLPPFGLE